MKKIGKFLNFAEQPTKMVTSVATLVSPEKPSELFRDVPIPKFRAGKRSASRL